MGHINMKKSEKVLISCGILKEEIRTLIAQNNWVIKPVFLNSSLHVDFDKLWKALTKSLDVHKEHDKYVCYGACHPLMNKVISNSEARRTNVQNCVELVLGKQLFDEKLKDGAFFLFEDWAIHWETVTCSVFGSDPKLLKEIFGSEHKYLLAIRTPCSNNFTVKAEEISATINLPLQWIDVRLDNLEKELASIFR